MELSASAAIFNVIEFMAIILVCIQEFRYDTALRWEQAVARFFHTVPTIFHYFRYLKEKVKYNRTKLEEKLFAVILMIINGLFFIICIVGLLYGVFDRLPNYLVDPNLSWLDILCKALEYLGGAVVCWVVINIACMFIFWPFSTFVIRLLQIPYFTLMYACLTTLYVLIKIARWINREGKALNGVGVLLAIFGFAFKWLLVVIGWF